jgi:hypothetical protein
MNGKLGSCSSVRDQFAMLLYGELSFDEEGHVDDHLEACAECRAALAREKELHAAFDQVEIEPPATLLRQCREDLQERLEAEPAMVPPARASWWDRVVESVTVAPAAGWLKPVGALTLVALGFVGARLAPSQGGLLGFMSMTDPGASRVRYIEPRTDGRIQIVLDETRQRVVQGDMDDQDIRALLLAAAKDPSDPGLRGETVEILNREAQTADVRDALLYLMQRDDNAGVRLKAMDGLKPFAQAPEVRKALMDVLLRDNNPGVRKQAIDVLTQGMGETAGQAIDRDVVGALQELMNRESNAYLRQRSQRVLELVNASAETY